MDGLKPCPFCGSRAVDLRAACYMGGERRNKPRVALYVRCSECRVRGPMFKARGEGFGPISGRDRDRKRARAVEAWNRRAERTCRNACEWSKDTFHFICSECGAEISGDDLGDSPVIVGDDHERLRYCPNCGARVVDE